MGEEHCSAVPLRKSTLCLTVVSATRPAEPRSRMGMEGSKALGSKADEAVVHVLGEAGALNQVDNPGNPWRI